MSSITLFLMSEKGFIVLHELIKVGHSNMIDQIVLGRDKNVQNDFSDQIISAATTNGIKLSERKSAPNITSQYAIAISWRWMIKTDSNTKLIVVHDSLLPKYRGFAPTVNQLINHEPIIGATLLFASEEYDRGDIISQESIDITYPIKINDAIQKIGDMYSQLINELFQNIESNQHIEATPQNEQEASYSLWRDNEDLNIIWNQNADDIIRFIDAVGFPYLGASTRIGDRTIRIQNAELVDDVEIMNRDCGKVIFSKDGCPVVVCAKGLLKITNATYDDNNESVLPLEKFRIRFS
ncbi:MAG: methionyl-tRNA formyltransferase [Flavobacteriales bacterium]|nr:methionyl-tRNA formyltransferase [Flavobacteriales bacterium]